MSLIWPLLSVLSEMNKVSRKCPLSGPSSRCSPKSPRWVGNVPYLAPPLGALWNPQGELEMSLIWPLLSVLSEIPKVSWKCPLSGPSSRCSPKSPRWVGNVPYLAPPLGALRNPQGELEMSLIWPLLSVLSEIPKVSWKCPLSGPSSRCSQKSPRWVGNVPYLAPPLCALRNERGK